MKLGSCSAEMTTRRGGYRCHYKTVFLVGIPGEGVDQWRAACTQHLAKVVRERIAAISDTGSVVVADLAAQTPTKKEEAPQ